MDSSKPLSFMADSAKPVPASRHPLPNLSLDWRPWWPVAGGLLLLYGPTWWDLANSVWQSEEQFHGAIVAGIVLWMFWQLRGRLHEAQVAPANLIGGVLFGFGLLLYVLGRSQDILLFEVGSQIPVLAGVLLLMRGWAALRAAWFPLFSIVFMVPLPGFLVDALTGPLKQWVSVIAEQLLYHAGYPIARSGVVLTVGPYQLLVADACSGLHSIFSLSSLGILYCYLMRYSGWLRNGLLLAGVLPIAFAANVVRVILLILITYHLGDEAGQGFAHDFAGMALFIIALLMLFLWDSVLGWMLGRNSAAAKPRA